MPETSEKKITPSTKNHVFGPSRTTGSDVLSLSLKCFGTTKVTFNIGLGLQLFQSHLLCFLRFAKIAEKADAEIDHRIWAKSRVEMASESQYKACHSTHSTYSSILRHTGICACFPYIIYIALLAKCLPNSKFQEALSLQTRILEHTIHSCDFYRDSHSALFIQHAEAKLHWSLMDKHLISSDRSGPSPSHLKRWESVTKSY